MRRARWIAVVLLVGLTLSACGGGGGGTQDSIPLPDLTGTWDAVMTVTGGTQLPPGASFTAVLTLVQLGSGATGTFLTSDGLGGDMTGTVRPDGLVIDFTIAQANPCPGSFGGFASANSPSGMVLAGQYSGADCNGTLAAEFVATKRP